ncbi:MAG: 50S ribosomal protein L6 [Pseudomonadota bacterium]|nr:50S ribosomal protein L6 [Gammaproteobacteria bacterium]MEC8012483.1 50S ribosomal protein L6 [Pseudomonadota bacterium]HBF07913.1 50S ribosomal protein L6 [Gammaproteobacteria bacterium]|tara:strand:+ start:8579 stop:9115 length:537 start_codon:yes stop_codon:yes gene_type:complete
MSRVAKNPIAIVSGVEVKVENDVVRVSGKLGKLDFTLHHLVEATVEDGVVRVAPKNASNKQAWAQAGTARAIIANMVKGVSEGFEKRLQLVGVGYRAALKGKVLNLVLGFSHPVDHVLPEGVTAEVPTQTEIVLRSSNKELLGEVAANIRGYRPPEPYKGKGVRYADEHVRRKEAKKK